MLSDEVANYLQAFGGGSLGLTTGTNLFARPFPLNTPDLCVAISAYGGVKSDYRLGAPAGAVTPAAGEFPYFHVFVRGSKDGDTAAEQLARAIYAALDGLTHATLSGVLYRQIWSLDGPPKRVPGGVDGNQRPVWFLNMAADKNVSPS